MLDDRLSPRKSPSQARSRRTVERILDAAAHVFDEQGYSATTTNDIADEAGVSIGSLYQYFPNKDAVIAALAHRHLETAEQGLAGVLRDLGPDADLEHALGVVLDFLVDQHELDTLHLLVAHTAPRTAELAGELDRAKAHLVGLTSAALGTRIADDEDRELAAHMVVATIDAAVHDVIIRRPAGPARTAAVDLTVATALSIISSVAAAAPGSPRAAPRPRGARRR